MTQRRPGTSGQVLYLVACAAPPARKLAELVDLATGDGWTVCIIATPTTASWIDTGRLSEQTGYPVRSEYKRPDDPDILPRADAISVVPATFNTINKWAAGISDTFALGILNEALGLGLPVVVAPCVKPPLATHPAFDQSLRFLRNAGVVVLDTEAMRSGPGGESFRWPLVLEALRA